MKQHDIDLDLSRPQVMAILNVTPDSFFAGSRMPDATHVERRVKEAAAEGASIIDVGGYSSRPGADEVPADEEWRRVELGIGAVRRLAPGVLISVDTFRSEVAARAIEKFGPLIINDISAGELDPQMPATAARCGVPYVAMHMKGDALMTAITGTLALRQTASKLEETASRSMIARVQSWDIIHQVPFAHKRRNFVISCQHRDQYPLSYHRKSGK